MSDPQANKQTAIDFYELMFNDNQPREAEERYTGADYRHHNPDVGDGKDDPAGSRRARSSSSSSVRAA